MSSRGILLTAETPMPLGMDIALEIAWPVKVDYLVDLNLHVQGHIVRAIGNTIAVAIVRHAFRTRRLNPPGLPG